jgi:DNA-directed RNA polymerase alpha subunit
MVLDGMKESMIDFMLNVKALRFKLSELEEPVQRITQKFSGVKTYTSSDLKLPSGIELLNRDVHLFEITDPSLELIVDMRIEKGYGYYSIDFLRSREKKQQHAEQNLLLIDNDFKLVEYIKYTVKQVIEDFS